MLQLHLTPPKDIQMAKSELQRRQSAPLETPTGLGIETSSDISSGMNAILAGEFAPYRKTKNFHWHNLGLASGLREVHTMVDVFRDIATTSLIENWIDETERRTWFLFESCRRVA
jgi:DNA-binding ferritin-like protein